MTSDAQDAGSTTNQASTHHEEEAEKWNRYYAELPLVDADEAFGDFNLEFAALTRELLPNGGTALEAGSGGGWQSLALATTGKFEVTLLDFSENALSYAERLFETHGYDADFILGDIFEPGSPDYELVFNLGALEHYSPDEQVKFLQGLASRSQKFVLVLVPNRACYWYWIWRLHKQTTDDWPFGHEAPTTDLSEIFHQAGLRFVGQRWLAASWTEGFLSQLPGLDPQLREMIQEVHNSSVIPESQRAYLLAALGVVTDAEAPPGWDSTTEQALINVSGLTQLTAELATEMALRLRQQKRRKELEGFLQETFRRYREELFDEPDGIVLDQGSDSLDFRRDQRKLQKEKQGLKSTIIELSAHNLKLEKDNRDLRATLHELSEQHRNLEQELATSRDAELQHLREAEELRSQLKDVHESRLWRLGHVYWSLRRRVWPRTKGRSRSAESTSEVCPSEPQDISMQDLELPDSEPACFDLIVFPIIDWDFRYQRPQQLLSAFAREGHRGYYLGTRLTGRGSGIETANLGEGLTSVRLPGPSSVNLYQDAVDDSLISKWLDGLDELRRTARIEHAVCLVQFPFWGALALETRERWGWKVVYDCLDEHSGFETTGSRSAQFEQRLLEESDLVLATSKVLYDKVAPRAQRALLLRNGADYEHFRSAADPVPDSQRGDRPTFGYFGAISKWFDVDVVAQAAKARPDWQFVLIGSTFGADAETLKRLDNVELTGEMEYDRLPQELQRFDVALIPFRRTPLTLATNPVKFYEYLSAGKPVVAIELPELEEMTELFYPYRAREDFVPALEAARNEDDPELRERRMELARRNTWTARRELLDQELRNLHDKVSIIIVSFGNLEYLRLCLDSIWSRTVYPSYEVIVVDNGSGDEMQSWLRQEDGREDRLRVILNEENLGFPRANNQAIETVDDSKYVVLLNDDTIVTRGWISRLVGHLERHPEIGILGPVTNWAGNEARIKVRYDNIEDMESFARGHAEAHAMEIFDIPVMPLFCAILPIQLLREIGRLDERFGVGMFEDDDLSKRVRLAGRRVACTEDVFVHHWGRSSFGKMDKKAYKKIFEENRRKFEEKWGERWVPHRHRG